MFARSIGQSLGAAVLGLLLVGGLGFGAWQLMSDDGGDTTSASSPTSTTVSRPVP